MNSWEARRQPQTTLRPVELVTAAQAAASLRVSRRTVESWCRGGLFPGAFKTPGGAAGSGHWRIPKAAVDKLLADQQTQDGRTP